jgi:hypothetical protein
MLVTGALGVMGLVFVVLAIAQARAGRLSVGHGAAWWIAGIGLFLGGLLLGLLWRQRAPLSSGAGVMLGLVGVLALAFAFSHAVALSRLSERVKFLSQEVALLRSAARQGSATPGATDPGPTHSPGAEERAG